MSKVKTILNLQEEATHLRLSKLCEEYGASVHPKMRLADVLAIEGSGIDDELFGFALQAHFDFVVDERRTPIFAVEFDGPVHGSDEQKARDEKKLFLCRQFEFPLLRITARYLPTIYRNADLLSWCVEQWFVCRDFDEAQARVDLPPDESFDPMSIVALPGRSGRFPMWLSAEPRSKILSLQKNGRCRDSVPSEWIGVDQTGNYHGIMWLWVNEGLFVYAESAARAQSFAIIVSELLSEVLTFELYTKLECVLRGEELPVEGAVVDDIVKGYGQRYRCRRSCSA